MDMFPEVYIELAIVEVREGKISMEEMLKIFLFFIIELCHRWTADIYADSDFYK